VFFPLTSVHYHLAVIECFLCFALTRYELHVRFLPKDLRDLFVKDHVTFYYLFDQVLSVTFLTRFNNCFFLNISVIILLAIAEVNWADIVLKYKRNRHACACHFVNWFALTGEEGLQGQILGQD